MPKISALPSMSSPGGSDEIPIVDTGASTTRKITVDTLGQNGEWVDTGGIAGAAVTPPKWTNPYKFRAYRSATVSVTDNTSYDIIFDTEEFDTNSDFNTTTGQYTVPVTGYYQINANARINGSSGTGWLWHATLILFKDSTSIDDAQLYVYDQGRFTFITLHIGGLYYLTAGEVLKVRAYADKNVVANWTLTGTAAATNFSGFLVSET